LSSREGCCRTSASPPMRRSGPIGVVGVAPAIRTEIGLGLDERTRIGDDVQDALVEAFGRDRLGEKFGDAGVARIRHTALFGMTCQHDDGRVGVALGFRLPDHLRKFEPVEDRHRPVGDDDIGDIMSVHFERGRAVLGFVDFAGAERMQQRAQDAAHMRVVVADEEAKLVEVDTKHGRPWPQPSDSGCGGAKLSQAWLTKGCRWCAGCFNIRTARAGCAPRGCGRDRTACALKWSCRTGPRRG